MVFIMELTYSDIEYKLDVKHFDASSTGYTLPPSVYEISDINSMLYSFFPNEVKVNGRRNDDFRLRSNSTTNEKLNLTKKSFFYITIGFFSILFRSFR